MNQGTQGYRLTVFFKTESQKSRETVPFRRQFYMEDKIISKYFLQTSHKCLFETLIAYQGPSKYHGAVTCMIIY
jgi:hypothetical protein